jgi:hypothetical protein
MKKTLMALTLLVILNQGVMADPVVCNCGAAANLENGVPVRKNKPVRNLNFEILKNLKNKKQDLKKEFYKKFETYLSNEKGDAPRLMPAVSRFIRDTYLGHEGDVTRLVTDAVLEKVKKFNNRVDMKNVLKKSEDSTSLTLDFILSKHLLGLFCSGKPEFKNFDSKKSDQVNELYRALYNINNDFVGNLENWSKFISEDSEDLEQIKIMQNRLSLHGDFNEYHELRLFLLNIYTSMEKRILNSWMFGHAVMLGRARPKKELGKVIERQKIIDKKFNNIALRAKLI